jgi:hypothetical protein
VRHLEDAPRAFWKHVEAFMAAEPPVVRQARGRASARVGARALDVASALRAPAVLAQKLLKPGSRSPRRTFSAW